jgi:hypothetical protein
MDRILDVVGVLVCNFVCSNSVMVLNYVFIIMCVYVFAVRYCTMSPVYVQLKRVTKKLL